MKSRAHLLVAILLLAGASVAGAQSPGRQTANRAVHDLNFSEQEEHRLGADVSTRLRERYGVVQDAAVHRYVTLVGSVVAAGSARADLPWTFIVLDTEGVNAFSAPGGFVHITRGALALIGNESELAGVLAHEVGHVMARHTIRMIQKTRVEGGLANAATRGAFLEQVGKRLYAVTLASPFDRSDEMEADHIGVALANHAGYAPAGVGGFLAKLAERNAATLERSGMFASHADTRVRLDRLASEIRKYNFEATATGQARYAAAITYTPIAIDAVRAGAPGSVNPDRDARGGSNQAAVVVTVTAAEIAEFRRGLSWRP